MRCSWEHLEEHIGNLKNILGTDPPKKPKITPLPPTKTQKREIQGYKIRAGSHK